MATASTSNHSTQRAHVAQNPDLLRADEAREQMRRYFSHITYGCAADDRIGVFSLSGEEFRSFASDKVEDAITYALNKQAELIGRKALMGIYAQQGVSKVIPTHGKRWKSKDIATVGALFLDVDFGSVGHQKTLPPTLDEALAIVSEFPLEPSMIVCSGGGLYPYYLLDERINGEDFQVVNKRLIEAYSHIQVAKGYAKCDSVVDATRVLRIPGTVNGKAGGRRQAYIYSENLTASGSIRRYSLGDIETAIADIEAKHAAADTSKIVQFPVSNDSEREGAVEALTLDDEAIVKLLLNERTEKGRKLYHGDTAYIEQTYGGDWSSADEAFIFKLAFYTRDTAQIDRIWLNSPLAQRAGVADAKAQVKTLTRDSSYRTPTIAKALQRQTAHYKPKRREENGIPEINASDTGNADRFIELMQERARWGAEDKMWYVLDERSVLWEKNSDMASAHIRTVVKDLSRDLAKLAQAETDAPDEATRDKAEALFKTLAKWITTCQSGSHPEVMLKQARSAMTLKRDLFDSDHMALATFTKRLDLTNGRVSDRMPEHYFTKRIDTEFNEALTGATLVQAAPTWHRFINDVFNGDAALIDYIQRALGYSLTGDVREQKMFVLYGSGSNGKSTLMEVINEILGDYVMMVNSDVLSVRSYRGGASPDIAKLKGVRIAIASESDETAVFDEARVKSLTGGDTINARPLFGAPINFKPTHKIWLTTNHKPEVRGTDNGIWRRLILVPMDVTFDQRLKAAGKVMAKDPDMKAKLLAEAEGILAWLVAGCLKWQQRGLDVDVPEAILRATEHWREDADVIMHFLNDSFVVDPNGMVTVEDMNAQYNVWCAENMLDVQHERGKTATLVSRLAEKGIKQKKINKGRLRVYVGVRQFTKGEIDEQKKARREVYDIMHSHDDD